MRRALLAICLSVLAGIPSSTKEGHATRAVGSSPLGLRTVQLVDAASWQQFPAGLAHAITIATTPQARLTVGNPSQGATYFGNSVALDGTGTTALIGAPFEQAAYVFTRSGSGWPQQARLTVGNSAGFGAAVALDRAGTTAVIGAPDEQVGKVVVAGATYVFTRSGGGWTQQARLTAGNSTRPHAEFGFAVALNRAGTIALIGALGENSGIGAAYVFTRSGSGWTQEARLTARSSAQPQIGLGWAVALNRAGTVALIGAPQERGYTGAAYVFTRNGSGWVRQARLTAGSRPRPKVYLFFGNSVALTAAGTTALIGSPGRGAGAAYVFTRNGSRWVRQTRLTAGSSIQPQPDFGWAVALNTVGTIALISAPREQVGEDVVAGVGYVFTRSGSRWVRQTRLTAGNSTLALAEFGFAVALDREGTIALVGAPDENLFTGAAYMFVPSGS